jgi:hypothetical protein
MTLRLERVALYAVWHCIIALSVAVQVWAQETPNERAFPQSKVAVEKVLASVQASLSGHLPVLDGFARPAEHPLDRYQRGYFQSTVQVSATASGGSLVRITTKVTAWYADPLASHSGYQLLISNCRRQPRRIGRSIKAFLGIARHSGTSNLGAVSEVPRN